MATGGKLRLEEGTGGGTHVGFKAPDTEVVDELLWTLPATDGTSGQAMVTDGNKNLSWSSVGSSTATATVSSSDLENQTEVTLVAAPGAGKYVNLLRVAANVTSPKSADLNIGHSGETAQAVLSLANAYGGVNVSDYQKIVENSAIVAKATLISRWTEQTGSGVRNWGSVASSSDGTKLVAADNNNGYIYTSTDSGVTWTAQTASGNNLWKCVASSSDGTKLVAGIEDGYLYTSTDSGVTWTAQTAAGSRIWNCVASSSDGTKLVAGGFSSYLYTSTDSGVSWVERTSAGQTFWKDVASSSDGTKLVAADNNNGYIYTSTDSGVTWTAQTASGNNSWDCVASSSDGTKLVAGIEGGYLYTSTDSGVTWTAQTAAGSRTWSCVASSSDGSQIAAGGKYGDYIYLSTDSGVTWTEQTAAGSEDWEDIAMSSDGTKLVAVPYNNNIFTYEVNTTAVDLVADYTVRDLPA